MSTEKDLAMSTEKQLEIYICGVCRPKNAGADSPLRPGLDLAKDLAEKLEQQGLNQRFELKIMQCMSVCSRPATASIVCPGKFTYTIGDLDPNTAADDLITFAKFYAEAPDGIPAFSNRPEAIRNGTIARTPSFEAEHKRITKLKSEPTE